MIPCVTHGESSSNAVQANRSGRTSALEKRHPELRKVIALKLGLGAGQHECVHIYHGEGGERSLALLRANPAIVSRRSARVHAQILCVLKEIRNDEKIFAGLDGFRPRKHLYTNCVDRFDDRGFFRIGEA